jgi:hypothetical protein
VTTSTTKQSKSWVIAAAALVVFLGILIWVVSRPSVPADELTVAEPTPPPATAATEPPKPAAATPAPAVAAEPEIAEAKLPPPEAAGPDLFAGEMPDFMADLHARVLDKKFLNVSQQKQLYKWGQEHKNDARPQLLLAWDSRNRDWDGMAINVYGIAFRADPRATQDLNNLRDLLDLASQHQVERVEFTEASDIVQKHFGLNALPVIDEMLEKYNAAGDVTRATRLSQMRDKLRGR